MRLLTLSKYDPEYAKAYREKQRAKREAARKQGEIAPPPQPKSRPPARTIKPTPVAQAAIALDRGEELPAACACTISSNTAYRANPGLSVNGIDFAQLETLTHSSKWRDNGLYELMRQAGILEPGQTVSQEVFDSLDWVKTYRGVAENSGSLAEARAAAARYAEDWKTGDFYPGIGIHANGAYSSSLRSVAEDYAAGRGGQLLQIAIRPEAKVVELRDLERQLDDEFAGREDLLAYKIFQDNPADYAVARGYDIIKKTRSKETYYILLNRGAVVTVR